MTTILDLRSTKVDDRKTGDERKMNVMTMTNSMKIIETMRLYDPATIV